jgi:putative acetyltransferase
VPAGIGAGFFGNREPGGAVIQLRDGPAPAHGVAVLIRREGEADAEAIRAITAAAFARPGAPGHPPPEVRLVDELRESAAWIPALSLVATGPGGDVTGHVLCTRGHVGDVPVLALGPLSVRPDRQRTGVGSALMHAVLGAGDALDEPLVALLGDPGYYGRFGFRLGRAYQITPPVAGWQPHFQVRLLTAYRPPVRGPFRYAEPFDRT